MPHESRYESAPPSTSAEQSVRHEVRLLRGFYRHLAIYLLVNGGVALLHLFNHQELRHASGMLIGWGIALAIHGLRVRLGDRWLGREWEEAQVSARLQRSPSQR
ncbi:MAG: hypothetical protein D3M94_19625 [Rhodocyclales bacterium GT-UBC]|nr:MAG: hypothetical protein D3M94_19625 [Rhodocyclales bacterium GT-UBC]